MDSITPEQILQYRDKPDSYVMAYVNLEGCTSCEGFKPVVESMAAVFPEIEFKDLKVTSLKELPAFAPPAMPSLVMFYEGYRAQEFHGITNSREQLKEVIKSWVL